MTSKSKPRRGSTVILTFELGNPGRLEAMLYNLHRRAVVHGRINCRIDGAPWEPWDRQEDEWAEQARETRQRHEALKAELGRDPSRTDEEIAALCGYDIKYKWSYSDDVQHARHAIVRRELENKTDEEIATLAGVASSWISEHRTAMIGYHLYGRGSDEQIAALVGVSPEVVGDRRHAMLEKYRATLAGQERVRNGNRRLGL
jgi:hypothetical protein